MEAADQDDRPLLRQRPDRDVLGRAAQRTIRREILGIGPLASIPETSQRGSGDGTGNGPPIDDDGDRDAIAVATGQEFACAVERVEQNEHRIRRHAVDGLLADDGKAGEQERKRVLRCAVGREVSRADGRAVLLELDVAGSALGEQDGGAGAGCFRKFAS